MSETNTTKQDAETAFATTGKVFAGTLALGGTMALRAVVVAWGWNRFGVAYGGPEVSLVDAFAFNVLATYALIGLSDSSKKESRPFWEKMRLSAGVSLMIWGILALLWWMR